MQDDVLWMAANDNAKDFVLKLLERDPRKRLTAREALQHPWLAGDLLQNREVVTGIADMLCTKRSRLKLEARQAHIEDIIQLMSSVWYLCTICNQRTRDRAREN
jgi:serine/threonine protein kinase